MEMNFKTLLVAGLLAATTLATNAIASPTWTVTASGKIVGANEDTGVFGFGTRNLIGVSYTQSITASIDPSKYAV